MRSYLALFQMRFIRGLQYRTAALAGIFTQFFWGFMHIMIFEAFYTSSSATQPINFHQLVNMLWLQQAFLAFIMLWFRDNEIINQIIKGDIAIELLRPIKLYEFWYSRLLAQRSSSAMLRFLPILIVAFLLPYPYNFVLPQDVISFLLFIVTLCLGVLIVVALSMLIYISMFYTLSGTGSILIFGVIGEFLAGLIIPIPLMPEALQRIVYLLPFRYTTDLPFRIYVGSIPRREALISICIQVIWLIILYIIGKLWMSKALKRLVIQGG